MATKFIDLNIEDYIYKSTSFTDFEKIKIVSKESFGENRITLTFENGRNINPCIDCSKHQTYDMYNNEIVYYSSIKAIKEDVDNHIYWINRAIEKVSQ